MHKNSLLKSRPRTASARDRVICSLRYGTCLNPARKPENASQTLCGWESTVARQVTVEKDDTLSSVSICFIGTNFFVF